MLARRAPNTRLSDHATVGEGHVWKLHSGLGSRCIKSKWGLLLPGAPEPRLTLLRRQDFKSVFQTASRGLSNRSIVVVGNYEFGPITVEPCRAKARPLRPRRSYFAPAGRQSRYPTINSSNVIADDQPPVPWWRRRVLPPGPIGLLRRPFIAIAGLRQLP
jgi:hypothetical protein